MPATKGIALRFTGHVVHGSVIRRREACADFGVTIRTEYL